MSRIAIVYSSIDGQTLKICQRLEQVLTGCDHAVTLIAVADVGTVDLPAFDRIVIGASIRYGKHSRSIRDFVERHRPLLERKAGAFFSVNIVARKPGKNTPESNPYLRKFLARTSWQPGLLAVFAGKLDYPRYGFFDRQMIRLIMLLTGGPTDPTTVVEFTDWQAVDDFGRRLGREK